MNWYEIIFVLLFLHALGDFALQTDVMAKGKNRHIKPEYLSQGQSYKVCWVYWMLAHSLIQGGLIWFVFGNLWIGLIEVGSHFVIDVIKCENITNPHHDQLIHFVLRITYSFILVR